VSPRRSAAARAGAVALFVTVLTGCRGAAGPDPTRLPRVSQRDWDRARASLASARAELPREPYTLVVSVEMREPRTGRTFSARGGLAVLPGKSVRLQLLGPGGATALDAWLTRERFRFDVPAADIHKRGRVDGPDAEGLPVAFFRFWFLSQLDGRLLFGKPTREGVYLVLRDGAATVEMFRASRGGRVEAERTVGGQTEELSVDAWAARPSAGDRALYRARGGVSASVVIESIGDEVPDLAAFEEPL